MNGRDPLDVFGLSNPWADEAATVSDADEARLVRIVETPIVGERRLRPGRRRQWVVVAGVGAVVLATAAFALVRRERASSPTGIVCYGVADLDGDRAVLGPALDPVGACEQVWLDGQLSTDGAPALAGCVNEAGVAAVFPGDQTVCQRLGLAELVPGRTSEQQAIVELGDQMIEVFDTACFRQAEALATAQEMLDGSGLVGWTVHLAEDFPAGRECGVATPLPDIKTVIVGGGRPEP